MPQLYLLSAGDILWYRQKPPLQLMTFCFCFFCFFIPGRSINFVLLEVVSCTDVAKSQSFAALLPCLARTPIMLMMMMMRAAAAAAAVQPQESFCWSDTAPAARKDRPNKCGRPVERDGQWKRRSRGELDNNFNRQSGPITVADVLRAGPGYKDQIMREAGVVETKTAAAEADSFG
jgi:hypothetical protein